MLRHSRRVPHSSPIALPTQNQMNALRELLRSSQLPSNASHYHSQIESSMAVLKQYDTDIERLGKALDDLILDRSRLQDYVDGCQAAVSPVRRLPPEILGEIFTSLSFPSGERCDSTEELENLGGLGLLQLSAVCFHWRSVIMGTPSLWSQITLDLDVWPERVDECTLFLDLAEKFLERGACHPLTISLNVSDRTVRGAVFALLSRHCRRWRDFEIYVDNLSHMEGLSELSGKLPSLQTLSFISHDDRPAKEIGIFETAHSLNKVFFEADPSCCPKLPWNQLRHFIYNSVQDVPDLGAALALMGKMSHPDAAFELRRWDASRSSSSNLPRIASTITSLLVEIYTYTTRQPHHAIQVLGDVLDCLTLTHLRKLDLRRASPSSPVFWPTSQFLSLSRRSSLCNTLRTLDLRHVTITEDELLCSLASLRSLENLLVADQEGIRLGRHHLHSHVLVTDELLARLALTPDPSACVAPHLKYFALTSFFKFDAHAYVDFALSRTPHGATSFHAVLHDFANNSYRFESAHPQPALDFIVERQREGENM
ncbi:hypothetical protein C8R43DRAFT_974562 [Mycena crocata]|nr:hypothetical protein C8R43DRAFT_974562 [Mycena crocata]